MDSIGQTWANQASTDTGMSAFSASTRPLKGEANPESLGLKTPVRGTHQLGTPMLPTAPTSSCTTQHRTHVDDKAHPNRTRPFAGEALQHGPSKVFRLSVAL